MITLDANAAFHSFVSPNAPQSTLPAPIDAIVEAIIGICATASTLLGDEDIRANVEDGWTAARQHESAWVHEDKKARLTADIADAFAFTDAMKEISIAAVIAGISPEDMGAWLTNHYREDLAVMPALSFYYEAISDKRADPRAPWERNDLHDLMFLCTAAAYADYTVGERRTVDLLKRSIRRQSKDVVVCSSIAELMSRPEMADMRSRG
ncbi:hypothetical protein [Clavibacter michiganensis]|uniref:hypothetical protein n=1 Tax=Clavibacter michiganensis TaxID=28447 RepID=UPI003078BB1B